MEDPEKELCGKMTLYGRSYIHIFTHTHTHTHTHVYISNNIRQLQSPINVLRKKCDNITAFAVNNVCIFAMICYT